MCGVPGQSLASWARHARARGRDRRGGTSARTRSRSRRARRCTSRSRRGELPRARPGRRRGHDARSPRTSSARRVSRATRSRTTRGPATRARHNIAYWTGRRVRRRRAVARASMLPADEFGAIAAGEEWSGVPEAPPDAGARALHARRTTSRRYVVRAGRAAGGGRVPDRRRRRAREDVMLGLRLTRGVRGGRRSTRRASRRVLETPRRRRARRARGRRAGGRHGAAGCSATRCSAGCGTRRFDAARRRADTIDLGTRRSRVLTRAGARDAERTTQARALRARRGVHPQRAARRVEVAGRPLQGRLQPRHGAQRPRAPRRDRLRLPAARLGRAHPDGLRLPRVRRRHRGARRAASRSTAEEVEAVRSCYFCARAAAVATSCARPRRCSRSSRATSRSCSRPCWSGRASSASTSCRSVRAARCSW